MSRLPFLDLLRFSGALLVMFGHLRGFFFESITRVEAPGLAVKFFYLLTGLHHEGVVIFFIVSGYLIGGQAWALIEQGRFDVTRYFVDRFSRIYLVFIPALVLILVLDPLGTHVFADTRLFGERPLAPSGVTSGWAWSQIPCHLAQLQSLSCATFGIDPPLWSLAYEWQFYFLAPLLIGLCYAPFHLLARAAGVAILTTGLFAIFPGNATVLPLFAIWFLGAVSARMAAHRPVAPAWAIAGLVAAVACLVLSRTRAVSLAATDAGLAIGLALACAAPALTRLRIADGVVRRGAAFSYSLYLIHVPVGLFIGAALERAGWPRDLAPPGWAAFSAFALAGLGTLVVAYLFASVTEARTDNFRQWLRPRVRRAPATVPGAEGPSPRP